MMRPITAAMSNTPGLYSTPFFIFSNSSVDVIRIGNCELYKEDIAPTAPDYPELHIQVRTADIAQEGDQKIAYCTF